ncbi:nuclear transport factor 2 family protein [Streptomyces sp. NPDC088124]|uniref:nuclear transport factor 2 family protein n=1 Tax=Streptomyces sp. NPDC088124 TaxID=3154654 RepID=UPI003444353D
MHPINAVPHRPEQLARETLVRYLELCDVPRSADATGRIQDLFTQDAVWEGVGPLYSARFGRATGREAIAAMVSSHLPPSPQFQANVHLLHPGTIMADDGEVRGRWLMQQLSRYGSGEAELVVARLALVFRVDTGRGEALISRFRTERIFETALASAADGTQVTA